MTPPAHYAIINSNPDPRSYKIVGVAHSQLLADLAKSEPAAFPGQDMRERPDAAGSGR